MRPRRSGRGPAGLRSGCPKHGRIRCHRCRRAPYVHPQRLPGELERKGDLGTQPGGVESRPLPHLCEGRGRSQQSQILDGGLDRPQRHTALTSTDRTNTLTSGHIGPLPESQQVDRLPPGAENRTGPDMGARLAGGNDQRLSARHDPPPTISVDLRRWTWIPKTAGSRRLPAQPTDPRHQPRGDQNVTQPNGRDVVVVEYMDSKVELRVGDAECWKALEMKAFMAKKQCRHEDELATLICMDLEAQRRGRSGQPFSWQSPVEIQAVPDERIDDSALTAHTHCLFVSRPPLLLRWRIQDYRPPGCDGKTIISVLEWGAHTWRLC